jgi:PAS domain-containing protein
MLELVIILLVISIPVIYFIFFRKKSGSFNCTNVLEHLDEKIFPYGEKQKREGARHVMTLLKNKINIQEAEELYVNKIALFYFEKYDSSNDTIINHLSQFENEKVNFFDKIELYDFFTQEHQKYTNTEWHHAYALHEITLNSKGVAVDYRFLDANLEFEKLTGYSKIDLIGKTIKQLHPSIDDFWINTYGKVATKGELLKFDHFDNGLEKHLDVISYSPKAGRFISFLSEREKSTPNKVTIRA